MSLSAPNIKNEEEVSASKVWLTEDAINLELIDGRTISVPLAFYPTLADASEEDRSNFELFGMGTGINWPTLDIDLEVAGIVAGRKEIPGLMERFKKFQKDNKLPT